MLFTALGFPEIMSHRFVLATEVQGFSQELLPPLSQSVLRNSVEQCTLEYYRKYEVKMTHILFKFIIYPSCDRAVKNGRVKSKIGNCLFHIWSGQLSCIRLYQAKLKQSRIALFEIVIFNSNFAFCVAQLLDLVMSSFFSMS